MTPERLRKYHAGDHETFNRIMEEFQEPIFYFVLRLVGNSADAEDLTQEAFVKAYTERKKFRGDSAINTWIYRIAANLAKNHLRWRALRNFVSLDSVFAEVLNVREDNSSEEIAERESELLIHLQELSPKQRSVFILRYFNELSHKEIAQIMNMSESSSKTNFHYAVTALKEMVQGS